VRYVRVYGTSVGKEDTYFDNTSMPNPTLFLAAYSLEKADAR
jgi:hypothetical protein